MEVNQGKGKQWDLIRNRSDIRATKRVSSTLMEDDDCEQVHTEADQDVRFVHKNIFHTYQMSSLYLSALPKSPASLL